MSSEADHVVEGFFDSLSRQSTGSLDSTKSIRDLVQAEILYHIFFSQCSFSKLNVYNDIWLSIITLKTTENCFFKPELYQERKCTVPSISFLFARKTIGMPCNSFSISNDVSRSSASWSRSRADPSITKSIPINKIKINQNKCMKAGYYASLEVQGFWSDPPYIVRIIAEKNNWLEKMAIVIVAAHVIHVCIVSL